MAKKTSMRKNQILKIDKKKLQKPKQNWQKKLRTLVNKKLYNLVNSKENQKLLIYLCF